MTTDAQIQYIQNQCTHDNTIDVGDAEHTVIVCTDCSENLTMEYYTL